MSSQALVALATLGSFLPALVDGAAAVSKPPTKFCTKSPCPKGACPVSIATDDAVYPTCKVYDTKTVLGGHGFKGSPGGGTIVFADIAQPPSNCEFIVKSPSNTNVLGCGHTIGTFRNAVCIKLEFAKTFMVQKCCGNKCAAAGGGKMIRGMDWKRSGSGGLSLVYENGTVIEPIQVGEPPEFRNELDTRDADASLDDAVFSPDAPMLEGRDAEADAEPEAEPEADAEAEADYAFHEHISGLVARQHDKSCKSWKPDAGKKVFTKPAKSTKIVATNVDGGNGGAHVQITKTRTQSWSITMTAGVNIGVVEASTSITFEQSISDSKAYTFNIPAGQSGSVGFTANLKCSTGTCGGSKSHGTVCTPYKQGGYLAGTFAVIAQS